MTGLHRRDRLLQRPTTRLVRVFHNPNGTIDVFIDCNGATTINQFIKRPRSRK